MQSLQSIQSLQSLQNQRQRFRFWFRLRSSDLQSDGDLDSIRNSCDVSYQNTFGKDSKRCIWWVWNPLEWDPSMHWMIIILSLIFVSLGIRIPTFHFVFWFVNWGDLIGFYVDNKAKSAAIKENYVLSDGIPPNLNLILQ